VSKSVSRNLPASVRQKLLNISKSTGDPFDLILIRYALERFLYRLSISTYANQFILKGAMLLAVWGGGLHRPTRDLDLLGYGNMSIDLIADVFKKICQVEAEPDGLTFDMGTLRVEEIREQEEYQGHRVQFTANLAEARIHLQVDIGYGDLITPEASYIDYPTLLEYPAPKIRAYPKESVVSEKVQAMVALGMVNSRLKDFYDIWIISKEFGFEGQTLVESIIGTFNRRSTDIPISLPTALTEEFANDAEKMKQWRAFLQRSGLVGVTTTLPQVIDDLKEFLFEPFFAAAHKTIYNKTWFAGGPWS
jgi:hypothetical protein